MTTINLYCQENLENLINYEQRAFAWRGRYNVEDLSQIEHFREIERNIPDLINRNHIINTIRCENYYQAFAEILFWGLLGTRPHTNNSKRTEIALTALSYPTEKILHIFETVRNGNLNSIEILFRSLERNGANKIPEVDVPYFTKILSFASEAFNNNYKLLIYDKWTQLMHVHLMLDLELNPRNYYTANKLQKIAQAKGPQAINANCGHLAYLNYCTLMHDLANNLSANNNIAISSFQLEGYLFGTNLKKREFRNHDNPRFWYLNNLSETYGPFN